ncbi:hypothetical protein SDC9_125391 [bioreactor metagenome]|uniref:Uncharacterized protein n=1 Tax=bioreactor metagenome TaxID=1076179 RepID=A0A645CMU2_9ZZZZ
MFSVSWNRQTDTPTGLVSYEGAVSLSKLRKNCPTTVELLKGTILPGTRTTLQADNYGIEFKNLYKHLNHLVKYITEQKPAQELTDNFKNPYTGETTIELLMKSDIRGNKLLYNTHVANNDELKEIEKKHNTSFFTSLVEWLKSHLWSSIF